MLRKYDANDKSDVYYCCDEDFNTAFAMAKVFMEHTLLIATILPGEKIQPKDMSDPHRYMNVLKALPEEFTRDQFKIEYMKCHNAGRATINRRLDNFVTVGLIERIKKDYYRKTDKMTQFEKDFIKECMSEIRCGK